MPKAPQNEINARFRTIGNERYIKLMLNRGEFELVLRHLGELKLTLDLLITFDKDTVWNVSEVKDFIAKWNEETYTRIEDAKEEKRKEQEEQEEKQKRHEEFMKAFNQVKQIMKN